MIIVCGNSVEEIKQNLHMVEMAVASGMPCGVGGATMADVAKAMQMMEHMGLPCSICNPNYVPDEWDDVLECCPDCGSVVDYDPDTDTCEDCGRGYEDEYPYGDGEEEEEPALPLDIQRMIMAFAEMLNGK